MDNLTHGLLGVTIGALRRPEGRPDPVTGRLQATPTDKAVFWATLLAAEAPDIDIFFRFAGEASGLRYHRGITHSLLGALALSALVTWLVRRFFPQARATVVYGWALVSMLVAHLLDDLLTSYGTRVLLPFDATRYALDVLPILDPLFTLPLLAAVLAGRYWPLLRRRLIAGAGALVVLYTAARAGIHADLQEHLAREFGPAAPRSVGVFPALLAVRDWHYVIDLPDRYVVGTVRFPAQWVTAQTFAKAPDSPVLAAAYSDGLMRDFLDFAAYPWATVKPIGDHYLVQVTDLRYRMGNRSPFTATVLVNRQYRVVESHLRDWTPQRQVQGEAAAKSDPTP